MLNDPDFTIAHLERIHARQNLPEPFVWVRREDCAVAGLIEGWIQDGVCAVDHLIVLPGTRRKFHTMMAMSREATSALHARGLDVIIKIARNDERYKGLEAWADRCGYAYYANDGVFDWYTNPASKGTT